MMKRQINTVLGAEAALYARTICANCKNRKRDFWREPRYSIYVCLALPRKETIDLVTGKKAFISETPGYIEEYKYPECESVNTGQCPHYVERKGFKAFIGALFDPK